jgi:hypothetical protein
MNTTLRIALLVLTTGCRSAGHLPVARDFVAMQDVYGDSAELASVLDEHGAPPWTVLVGGADQLEPMLAARVSEAPAATIVDLSLVDPMQRDAVVARALEAVLELDGALLLDHEGANARALRGDSRALTSVVLNEDRSVASATEVTAPEPEPSQESGR